jgi:hypothetical protein
MRAPGHIAAFDDNNFSQAIEVIWDGSFFYSDIDETMKCPPFPADGFLKHCQRQCVPLGDCWEVDLILGME